MLRITTSDRMTFRLEGKLTGPWVEEMNNCWQSALARGLSPEVRVDLTAMTAIDRSGKELLARMHTQGVQFVASGCWAKGILAEIAAEAVVDPECSSTNAEVFKSEVL
jgi:hypothetical protein